MGGMRAVSLFCGALLLTSSLHAAPPQLQRRAVITIAPSPEWVFTKPAITSNGEDFILVRMEANVLRWWRISPSGVLRDSVPGELRLPFFERFPTPYAFSNGRDFLVVWARENARDRSSVEFVRLDSNGSALDQAPVVIGGSTWRSIDGPLSFSVASDGSNYLVVWQDGPELRGSFIRPDGTVSPLPAALAPLAPAFDVEYVAPDYVLVTSEDTELDHPVESEPGCTIPIGPPPIARNLFARAITPEGQVSGSWRLTVDRRTHVAPGIVATAPAMTVFFESRGCRRDQRFRTVHSLQSEPAPGQVIEARPLSSTNPGFVTDLAGFALAAYSVDGDIEAVLLDPAAPGTPATISLVNDPAVVEHVEGVASAGRSLAVVYGRSVAVFTLPRARSIRR
jgi:hypothetical protein